MLRLFFLADHPVTPCPGFVDNPRVNRSDFGLVGFPARPSRAPHWHRSNPQSARMVALRGLRRIVLAPSTRGSSSVSRCRPVSTCNQRPPGNNDPPTLKNGRYAMSPHRSFRSAWLYEVSYAARRLTFSRPPRSAQNLSYRVFSGHFKSGLMIEKRVSFLKHRHACPRES